MSQLARDIFHDEDLVHRNEEGRNARECCRVNNHKKEVFAIEFGCAEGEVSVLVYLPVLHQKKSKRALFGCPCRTIISGSTTLLPHFRIHELAFGLLGLLPDPD